jgi:hypothetical protein
MVRARSLSVTALLVAAVLSLPAAPAAAEDGDKTPTLLEAITGGSFSLGFRYRFEQVDQDGFENRARASTLRTTVGYRMLEWHGLAAFFEVEDVHDLGLRGEHNNAGEGSLWNRVQDRPVIADPELTEFNQVGLDLRLAGALVVRAGRQEVTLGNHRLVGNVGWRQNHQSFEAVRVDWTGLGKATTVTYAFLDRVHRINGGSKPMASHLAEIEHSFEGVGRLRGYGYMLDYDLETDSGLSTATLGASFGGTAGLADGVELVYRAELADQRDAGSNPNDVDAGYRRADLGLVVGTVTATAGYEVLEGDPDDGRFTTPLATLHAFNGWADLFLTTPPNGLEDLFLSLETTFGRFKVAGVYHDFTANSGGADYGRELDLMALYTAAWEQKFGVKAALYDAESFGADTDKVWLWTEWSF